MTIGDNIKRIRLQRGLTQRELASLVGIAESAIRGYELGIRTPKIDKLQKISYALHINVETLINTNFDDNTAMHSLFQLFRQYDGYFDSDGNLQLQNINLSSWRKRWEIYQEELSTANQIKDERVRQNAVEDAKDRFNWWMDTFPQ